MLFCKELKHSNKGFNVDFPPAPPMLSIAKCSGMIGMLNVFIIIMIIMYSNWWYLSIVHCL